MDSFQYFKPSIDSMDHKQLFEFYKDYNSYIKNRTVLQSKSNWDHKIKQKLDRMSHQELAEFNKKFKSYIQNRLVETQ